MPNNTFGELFRVTTFGESHGKALGVVIDGVPSNLTINIEKDIQPYLDLRKPCKNIYTTSRKETDKVEVLSGIFNNLTLGTPICLVVYNHDYRTADYENIKNKFRPNHGDYTWQTKFGIRDYRGGGRSSARETVARVAAGAVARLILLHKYPNISVRGAVIQIGKLKADNNWDMDYINKNPFFSPDKNIIPKWEKLLGEVKQKGDSVGALIELRIVNVPPGFGEPVFDKLDAELAKALMSIPAVKSISIGLGEEAVNYLGSEIADEMFLDKSNSSINFKSNNSGGIQGGISNGNIITIRIALKPTSSIAIPKDTISADFKNNTSISTIGRHDPCVGIRAVPIAESMVLITLADFLLRHTARNNFK